MGKKAPAVPGYSLGDVLGEGTLASTRLGRPDDESRDLVAVKTVRKDHPRFQEEGLRREVAILERLKHPRVVKLVELVEDDEAFHLVEELGAGGEMFERILELGSFCEADAVHLIHQIVQGATYLHSQGVVHRDLKPENILMMGSTPNTDEYMRIKICDFGLSAMRRAEAEDGWAGTGMQIIAGTQSYMAPEIFLLGTMADQADGHDTMSSLDENQDMRVALARDAFQRALDQNEAIAHDGKVCMKPTYGEHCTAAVDIWAIGVIFFVMLRGEFPFEEDDHQIVKICSGQFEMNSGWDAISQQSQLFTRRCLCSNYKTRPTGPQLLEDVLFLNDALPRDNLDHVPLLRRHAATKHDHVAGKSVRSAIRLQNLGAKSAVNVIRSVRRGAFHMLLLWRCLSFLDRIRWLQTYTHE